MRTASSAVMVLQAGLVLVAAACSIDDLQQENRFCSPEWPCPAGLRCSENRCSSARSEAGPGDRGVDLPRDLSGLDLSVPDAPAQDHTPIDLLIPPDLLLPDHLAKPDGGCPSGTEPCGSVCVDTQKSYFHCSGCNTPCPPGVADRCEGGQCHCGSFGPLCAGGLNCVGGLCSCLVGPGSQCSGCCNAAGCQSGTSSAACGLNGVGCKLCLAPTCRVPICSGGACGTLPVTDGTACVSGSIAGTCYGGGCCTGCWSGTTCQPGTSTSACGKGGKPCSKCLFLKKCINGACL